MAAAAVLALAVLGCNYPGRGGLEAGELRQTLDAQQAGVTATTESFTPSPGTPGLVAMTPLPSEAGTGATYTSRSGDTLPALSARFGVPPEQITAAQELPPTGYLLIGTPLMISHQVTDTTPADLLIPDSAAVYSPADAAFDTAEFIHQAGGYLSRHLETVDGVTMSGAEIVQRVASEASVSPRLLLALLEHRAGWVRGQPKAGTSTKYPLGFGIPGREGLYQELVMAGTHLNIGYYGWREGTQVEIRFADGSTRRMAPVVNAGTAGLQNLLAKFNDQARWQEALYAPGSFPETYRQMFGDPWSREAALLPDGLAQPELALPFTPGERWSLSGGPHISWNTGSPRGALDFSPVTGEAVCAVSKAWATAAAAGVVSRAAHNVVALDLDGDGYEQTGWVLVYVHLAQEGLTQAGLRVEANSPLGHPSCERGQSTGKHVHVARKYNGEWIAADGPVPFVLSGWQARAGERNYQGELVKGGEVVSANPSGARSSVIVR